MKSKYPNLRAKMNEHGVSFREVAAAAGISTLVFHMKLIGVLKWKLTEVVNICHFFRTPDAAFLFYS